MADEIENGGKGEKKVIRPAQRRSAVWKLRMKGLTEVAIAKVFGVHRNTILNDLKVIKKQMRVAIIDMDVEGLIGETIAQYDEIANKALLDADSAGTATAKSGYLNTALRAIAEKMKLLMDTGVIPKALGRLEGDFKLEGLGDLKKMSLNELVGVQERLRNEVAGVGIKEILKGRGTGRRN